MKEWIKCQPPKSKLGIEWTKWICFSPMRMNARKLQSAKGAGRTSKIAWTLISLSVFEDVGDIKLRKDANLDFEMEFKLGFTEEGAIEKYDSTWLNQTKPSYSTQSFMLPIDLNVDSPWPVSAGRGRGGAAPRRCRASLGNRGAPQRSSR